MDKNEILDQLDTQLWPLAEISYTQNGQWFWYDFEPKQKDTEPLTIIWGGRERFKPATELKRQTAPYFCISYVLSGHGTLNIHGQTHKLEPGTLSGHCSGVPHHYSYDTQNPAEHIFVVFRGTEANELMQKSMIANLGALSASYSVDILRSMIDILKHSLNKTENSQRICSSHLRIV